jgi:hypothetical protein
MKEFLIYSGSLIIFIWGAAHIVPVKSIVKSFNDISADNKLILTMEWIAEGLTLAFIGTLVFLVSVLGDSANETSVLVYFICGNASCDGGPEPVYRSKNVCAANEDLSRCKIDYSINVYLRSSVLGNKKDSTF